MYKMANLNESLKDAMCIEDEVFFGPIDDKERKIGEHFENILVNENKAAESVAVENDMSKNDSLYQSFSVEESKYDSFDDSLNEELGKKSQEKKHITLRKNFDKLKSKRHGFYDSLEDVCSLVSNMDKCSISCEMDNNSNLNNKHIPEDSLMVNQPVVVTHKSLVVSEQDSLKYLPGLGVVNKNHGISEQINFDDDSLAILELENTFDDSLEEINVLSSVEIEEVDCIENAIDCIENAIAENQNIVVNVEQKSECMSRNFFDSSVQIVCERKEMNDTADQEESSDDKNLLYDSLSNSDFKDILKDSLEESEKCCEHLSFLKRASDTKTNSVLNSEKKFDTSVQIVYGKMVVSDTTDQEESSDDKNLLYDSLSNSDFKDILKDSLEESEKCCENLNFLKCVSDEATNNILKTEKKAKNQNAFDTSVQIIYENLQNSSHMGSISEVTTSDCNDISKDSLENSKNTSKEVVQGINDKYIVSSNATFRNHIAKNLQKSEKSITCENASFKESNTNNEGDKEMKDCSGLTDCVSLPNIDDSSEKEAFTADVNNLKILKHNISVDADIKFQMQVEMTVEDKKCQIGTENIKILPASGILLEKSKNDSFTPIPMECHFEAKITKESDAVDKSNAKLQFNNNKECDVISENIVHADIVNRKPETVDAENITLKEKSSRFHFVKDEKEDNNLLKNLSEISLFQALDLHDTSTSFLNESVIQSNNSLMPLNLCCRDQDIFTPVLRDEIKENIPQPLYKKKQGVCTSSKKASPRKLCDPKTPKHVQKTSSLKDSIKKTSGTKIPVRKIENFVVPTAAPNKFPKQVPSTFSAEKVKKCQHSPYSPKVEKKTTTPNKTPHFCKVRNTIFSKVPQIVPSKKYMNIQSPVAQYIKNNNGSGKKLHFEPVLRDCMNRPLESPLHSHHTPKTGTLKAAKDKKLVG